MEEADETDAVSEASVRERGGVREGGGEEVRWADKVAWLEEALRAAVEHTAAAEGAVRAARCFGAGFIKEVSLLSF